MFIRCTVKMYNHVLSGWLCLSVPTERATHGSIIQIKYIYKYSYETICVCVCGYDISKTIELPAHHETVVLFLIFFFFNFFIIYS